MYNSLSLSLSLPPSLSFFTASFFSGCGTNKTQDVNICRSSRNLIFILTKKSVLSFVVFQSQLWSC
ncbi:hypothetical protein MtrunA17_Chr5g0394501 [Medicago truncatula]|uniref:Uncharacterized protein n=1 Tax=Medicago truncatula TaxID=3880 RepID=A0A396HIZ5_MEDTR|nr:hypothetical protein MtrunA17_Chr5g0394501 [Medicago truncatula]